MRQKRHPRPVPIGPTHHVYTLTDEQCDIIVNLLEDKRNASANQTPEFLRKLDDIAVLLGRRLEP